LLTPEFLTSAKKSETSPGFSNKIPIHSEHRQAEHLKLMNQFRQTKNRRVKSWNKPPKTNC
jgi:hypothetical protein